MKISHLSYALGALLPLLAWAQAAPLSAAARERCERFRRLSPRTLRAMDASAVETVRRQCGQP